MGILRMVVVGVGIAGLVGACGSGGGPNTSSGTTGGHGSGGGSGTDGWGKSDCGTCVASACATEIAGCKGDPGCAAYIACLDACPVGAGGDVDAGCEGACPTGSSSATTQAIAVLTACRAAGPGVACAACGSNVPKPDSPVLNQTCPQTSTAPDACGKCQDEHCCDTIAACHADADCMAVRACEQGCNNLADPGACLYQCYQDHPAGANIDGQSFACATYYCAIDQAGCDVSQRTACEACEWTTCGDLRATFYSTDTGYELEGCLGTCASGDVPCYAACQSAFPESAPAFQNFSDCVDQKCPC